MSDDATSPAAVVGQQLARRREDLDLTQDDLAKRIGVSGRTISAIERGVNAIQRKNRSAWETALGLVPGTINRAYRDGTPVEVVPVTEEPRVPPHDDVVAALEARVTRMEVALDVERRAREELERKMVELGIVPADASEEQENEHLPRAT
jgi:transcriptional regulator with XRE-family HTH domain